LFFGNTCRRWSGCAQVCFKSPSRIIALFIFSPESEGTIRANGSSGSRVMGKMRAMQHDFTDLDEPCVTRLSETGPMPSGWWVLPGLVVGLGLWALIGVGVHAAITGGEDDMMSVTRSQTLATEVTPLD
jgi:hypothetical protein